MPDRSQQQMGLTTSAPKTLVVAGGKQGVGATTIAAKLATALAHDALRVVLVDADPQGGNLGTLCNLQGAVRIGDVLAGKKSIHEALQLGPAGIQALAGLTSADQKIAHEGRAIQRLLRQMASLAPHADWLLIDAGNQPSDLTMRLWSAAQRALVVTSPHSTAIMETYVLIKTLVSREVIIPDGSLALAINQTDEQTAVDVHRRIDRSCRRFLGVAVEFAGFLPPDPAWASLIPEQATGELAEAFRRLADRVLREWQPPGQQRAAA